MRHERQVLIDGWDQDALSGSSVLVIGVGSLGSNLVPSLARLGVGSITIVDPDTAEAHNLENQVFTQKDIGQAKVHALAEKVKAIDPAIRVTPIQARIQDADESGMEWDVMFGCLDNVATRYYINHLAVTAGKPLIDAGIESHRGVVMTIKSGTACQQCWPLLSQDERQASCSSDPIPSTYVTANATAMLQATQFLHLVHGRPVASHVSLDLARMTLHANHLEPNPECEACGDS